MKKLTVSLLAYKKEFLYEAIEGFLSQTYEDFNFNIFDDCSPYFLEEVLESFSGYPQINYIKNEENLGGWDNWLQAVNLCTSEYLIIPADDDIPTPNYIKKMMSYMENNSDVIMASCNYNIMNEKGTICDSTVDNKDRYFDHDLIIDEYEHFKLRGKGIHLCHPACIYRVEALKRINFEYIKKSLLVGDAVLELRMNEIGKLAILKEPLYNYRINSQQFFSTCRRETIDEFINYVLPVLKERLSETELEKVSIRYNNFLTAYDIGIQTQKEIQLLDVDTPLYLEKLIQEELIKLSSSLYSKPKYAKGMADTISYLKKVYAYRIMDYIIWGASNAGIVTFKIFEIFLPQLRCLGFIDSYKTGVVAGLPVITPSGFSFDKNTFIIIGTTNGIYEVSKFLNSKGMKAVDNYLLGYGFDEY